MFTSHLLVAAALALAPQPAAVEEPIIEECELSSIQDQMVPSSDSGVLVKMPVSEGMRVTMDMEVGRVDDREAQALKIVKEKDYQVAKQEAESNIDIRFAQASAEVAKKAWEKLKQANKGSDRAVSEIEVLKAELEYRKAVLQVEKAIEDRKSKVLAADAKNSEVNAAEVAVTRRVLAAPFDGVVLKVFRHEGEWVSPGDPVVQVVRVDRLRVSGTLPASDWAPADIEDRKVTVDITMPRGQVKKVSGRVVFVSPVVSVDELPVWAEIDVPNENGRPLIHAGLKAKMTIHVNQAPENAARPDVPVRRTAEKKQLDNR
jgi:multidrug efflux pump subunit AcrA (membrane-fusion protein)